MKLSVIVPCYNEADNIPLIIKRFKEILPAQFEGEILLVNNGSTDHSEKIFERELKEINDPRFKLVQVSKNQGYGFGILSGLAKSQGDVLAWTHADMQTDPNDVLQAFEEFCAQDNVFAFVKGRRKSRALIPWLFTWGMGVVASLALSQKLEDIGAQPKLFSRSFYTKFLQAGAPWDFSLDLYAQYWAQREGVIIEIPVYFSQRQHGEAKGGGSLKTRFKVTFRVLSYIFEMKKKLVKTPPSHP